MFDDDDRFLLVYDGTKFEIIEDWDFQFTDVPMTPTTSNFALLKQQKRAFEFVIDHISVEEVIGRFRVDGLAIAFE